MKKIFYILLFVSSFAHAQVGNQYLRGAINVKAYGATGDGSTDDQVAINRAYATAIAQSRDLYFPFGFYRVASFVSGNTTTNVVFDSPTGSTTSPYRIRIYGEDGTKITTSLDSNGTFVTGMRLFRFNTGFRDCIIENIFFENTHTLTTYATCPINLSGSPANAVQNMHITKCRFEGWGTSIIAVGDRDLKVDFCQFAAPKGRDQSTNNTSPAVFIWLFNNTSGLSINAQIDHNDFDGYTGTSAITTTSTKAPMDGALYGSCHGLAFHHNHIQHYGTEAILQQADLTYDSGSLATVISDNQIDGWILPGTLQPQSASLSVTNTGIRCEAVNAVIEHNTMVNQTTGIQMYAVGTWNFSFRKWGVYSNHIFMSRNGQMVQNAGIQIAGYSTSVVNKSTQLVNNDINFEGDTLQGNAIGIKIFNSDSVYLSGNMVNAKNIVKGSYTLTYISGSTCTNLFIKGPKFISQNNFDVYYGTVTSYVNLDSAVGGSYTPTSSASTIVISGSNLEVAHPSVRPTTTSSANTTFTLSTGDYIQAILVNPSSALSAFAVGTTPSGTDVVPTQALATGLNNFTIQYYASGSVTLYFSGITSSTVITLIKQQ